MSPKDREMALPLAGSTVVIAVDGPLGDLGRLYSSLGARVVHLDRVSVPADVHRRLARELARVGAESIELEAPHALERAISALNEAALLIEDWSIQPDGWPQALAACRENKPATLTVSMFGANTSYAQWRATDPILSALSGQLSRSGIRGREPLLPPGEISLRCAIAQAEYAGMLGLYAAEALRRPMRLDFSALDGSVQALDPGYGIGGSATLGKPAKLLSRQRPQKGLQYPCFPCVDGWVRICLLASRQWQGMFRWMGEPAEFADPKFNKTIVRYQSRELWPVIGAFLAPKSRAELEDEAKMFGVPLAALLSLPECLEQDHLLERRAMRRVELPGFGEAPVVNGALEIDGVRAEAGTSRAGDKVRRPVGQPGPSAALRPLEGVRVLDLGVIVVGGEQGRLLADMGADVVKVEALAFPDGGRQSYLPTGLSVSFAAGHRNKRSLGLNLRSDEGKALFAQLMAKADVVLSNFKPGTMESLGLGHEALQAINPRIITVESSAFGSHGPWAKRMGYGPLVRAIAGLTQAWRYADDEQGFADSITVYPDHVAARLGASAILALLRRRARIGRGGHISVSQLEVMLSHFEPAIGAAALGLTGIGEHPDAPWGVFPAAGDDEWCVVTVSSDEEWAALSAAIDRPDLAADPQLAGRAGRCERAAELNAVVAAWLASMDADQAMRRLQGAGVPAARMLRVADLPDFGYFRERELFRVEQHPNLAEEIIAESFHVKSSDLAAPPTRPAPLAGEHTAEIAQEWLGLSEEQIEQLLEAGVLEPADAEIVAMLARGEGRQEVIVR